MNAATASESFVYRQKTVGLNDIAGAIAAMHEDGFALIPSVINASEVAAAREAIDRLQPFGLDGSSWSELNDHFKCVFNRDRLWLSYLDRPGIVDLAEALMGDQCHIIGMTAWKSFPGYDGWRIHTAQLLVPVPETVFADRNFKLPVCVDLHRPFLSQRHYRRPLPYLRHSWQP